MNKKRVVVLGASGMLGSMVVDCLSKDASFQITASVRTKELASWGKQTVPNVNWVLFDADTPNSDNSLGFIDGCEWVINAIGITKPLINEKNPEDVARAVHINSILPFEIAHRTASSQTQVLQIATDCVYSGKQGQYVETDSHDALDVYGKTKSLGETPSPNVHHLRCSIIGPEARNHRFLLDWLRLQPPNAGLNGYVNHDWNGISTLHFAKFCQGMITHNVDLPPLQHIVPAMHVTKYDLLKCFAKQFDRTDLSINETDAAVVVDRTLATNDESKNREIWAAAGYASPRSIPEMVEELASYDYGFSQSG